jgi:hypothetical protein
MAAADSARQYRECGEPHNFFLVDGDLFERNTNHEYICPKTRKLGRLRAAEVFGTPAYVRPKNTIVVNRVYRTR